MERPSRSPLGLPLPEGLVRSRDDRVCAGVCAGIGRWLGVDPTVIRLAVVILSLASGVGVLAYLFLVLALPEVDTVGAGGVGDGAADDDADGIGVAAAPSPRNSLAVACITLGVLVLMHTTAPFFVGGLVWPAALAATGLGVVWFRTRSAPGGVTDLSALLSGPGLWIRVACGGVLLVSAFGWFLHESPGVSGMGNIVLAVVATFLGVAVLMGPWIVGLFHRLDEEHRERIRSEERADMAAHLHDSVLQTLALIQRQAESPQQARSLARRQERELRAWLFDDRTPVDGAPPTLAAALDLLSDDAEANHAVTVDVVIVGDCPVSPRIDALVAALREAVINAALHSGEGEVSVYVEVDEEQVDAYVRDRGKGFDPRAVYGDRRGIADSIVGRMARHGGRASIRSEPGEGTEVALHLDLEIGHPQ